MAVVVMEREVSESWGATDPSCPPRLSSQLFVSVLIAAFDREIKILVKTLELSFSWGTVNTTFLSFLLYSFSALKTKNLSWRR